MFVGRPQEIAKNPAFSGAVALLLPEPRLTAFERESGVDLRRVESGLIAGFDFGTLYMLEPPARATAKIVASFRERLVTSERSTKPHPELSRITGVIGSTPETLVSIEERLIAVAVGDPTPARVVEAFARKQLRKSPRALAGAALSNLTPAPSNAVATFYAPGPFSGEWAQGARGLLADTVAVRISLIPMKSDRARFELELAGDFPQDGRETVVAAFDDLRTSAFGKLLALDQTEALPKVEQQPEHLRLEIELDLLPLAQGLRAVVMADVWELLESKPAP